MRAVHLVGEDQQVPAEPVDQRATSPSPGRVGDERTGDVPGRSHGDDLDESQLVSRPRESRGREGSREEHGHLRRDRHARRPKGHQKEYSRVSVVSYLLGNEPAEDKEQRGPLDGGLRAR